MCTRKPVIAVLDDDPSVLKALARLLRAHDYGVETYASAEEYLWAAATSRAALLIVDMQLGQDSGLDVVRWLRLSENNKPFISISGSCDDTIKQSALEAGTVAYLDKPLSMDVLGEVVCRIVGPPHHCTLH
jgi:FixJ family two-component response regulator